MTTAEDHDLYFHAVQDLLRRYRTAEGQQRQRLGALVKTLVDHADDLGFTVDELGAVRSACCHEHLDLAADGLVEQGLVEQGLVEQAEP